MVHVETWNEWHEGTDIADSREYGRRYIVLTPRVRRSVARRDASVPAVELRQRRQRELGAGQAPGPGPAAERRRRQLGAARGSRASGPPSLCPILTRRPPDTSTSMWTTPSPMACSASRWCSGSRIGTPGARRSPSSTTARWTKARSRGRFDRRADRGRRRHGPVENRRLPSARMPLHEPQQRRRPSPGRRRRPNGARREPVGASQGRLSVPAHRPDDFKRLLSTTCPPKAGKLMWIARTWAKWEGGHSNVTPPILTFTAVAVVIS